MTPWYKCYDRTHVVRSLMPGKKAVLFMLYKHYIRVLFVYLGELCRPSVFELTQALTFGLL